MCAKALAADGDALKDGVRTVGRRQGGKAAGRHVVCPAEADLVEGHRHEPDVAAAAAIERALGDDALPGFRRIGPDGLFGLEDEVAEAVEQRRAAVEFDPLQQGRAMAGEDGRAGVDAASGEDALPFGDLGLSTSVDPDPQLIISAKEAASAA